MEGLTFYQAFHGLTIMGVMQLIPWLMIFIVDIYGVFYYIYIYENDFSLAFSQLL